jgi:phosphoenolpyruvate carboxykinase (ATP)
MQILGRPSAFGIETLGINGQERQFWNLSSDELIQRVIDDGECVVTPSRVVIAKTGKFTGRSANDKYIVNYQTTYDSEIDWGCGNQPIQPEKARSINKEVVEYLSRKDIYIQDLRVGQDPLYGKTIRVITEKAWHSLFAKNLFISDDGASQKEPDFTIIQVPGFFADPKKYNLHSETFIILDFEKRLVLIGGTGYAGEIKKSVFSLMNRILPKQGVLPMHCSANVGSDGVTALFFGLSGTGKTTLSSDQERNLIGDDEHGWGSDGIFNFEGGCYAKTIGLKQLYEPLIWEASQRSGTVLENVVYDKTAEKINFDDGSITENTRAAYPLRYIANFEKSGRGAHPHNVFFLSADAFGVLPPIALLDEKQAIYYFLSGFTAKLAGTEVGLGKEPQATFSSCFGAPFLPLKPQVYANLLGEKVQQHHTKVWLVNTGWSGGAFGTGERIKLPYTRAVIKAALEGKLAPEQMVMDEVFHLAIPKQCPGIPIEMLNPISTWQNKNEYLKQANSLLNLFAANFEKIGV